jgi:hypothetical protein
LRGLGGQTFGGERLFLGRVKPGALLRQAAFFSRRAIYSSTAT